MCRVVYGEGAREADAQVYGNHDDDIPELHVADPAKEAAGQSEVDAKGSHQAEYRARGAHAWSRREAETCHATREPCQRISIEEPPVSEEGLQLVAYSEERPGIQEDVERRAARTHQRCVQKGRRDQAIPVAVHHGDAVVRTPLEHLVVEVGRDERGYEYNRDESQEHPRYDRLVGGDP